MILENINTISEYQLQNQIITRYKRVIGKACFEHVYLWGNVLKSTNQMKQSQFIQRVIWNTECGE